MHQVSQKFATKVAFEMALELKDLQVAKIESVLKQEKDGKLIDIFQRMLHEEAHHLDVLNQTFAKLGSFCHPKSKFTQTLNKGL
ncbi:MAG: hypothetical protein H7X86_04825 [Gorillibacterium sp.]|nr:hypothetical protein [Gorillibacterium sp.]